MGFLGFLGGISGFAGTDESVQCYKRKYHFKASGGTTLPCGTALKMFSLFPKHVIFNTQR